MDYSPVVAQLLKLWWLIPIIIVIALLKTPLVKGYIGELLVRLAGRLFLDRSVYHPIHNVTLPTTDGTTQIDHIYVSSFGIFVVETKNMRGWIFGTEKQPQWTQKIFKQSFKFQNPLRQNYKHLKTLEAALDVSAETLHSVIAFVGDSAFKTTMPPNVCKGGGYVRYIKAFKEQVLSETEVTRVLDVIQQGRLTPSRATNRAHVAHLKERANPDAERRCPACGAALLVRETKKGARAGQKFWGCSGFPKCRVVQDIR